MKIQPFLLYLVSFTELSPLILISTVYNFISLEKGYMKGHMLISVHYNTLNKIPKIKICRLSDYESLFA